MNTDISPDRPGDSPTPPPDQRALLRMLAATAAAATAASGVGIATGDWGMAIQTFAGLLAVLRQLIPPPSR